jgi:hypothetical protein
MRHANIVVLILLLTSLAFAQSDSKTEGEATVYVYQLRHVRTLGKVAPPIYLDDTLIAKLDGSRFFIVKVNPGEHTFRTKEKKRGGIQIDFKSGQTYYVRMDMREGASVGVAGFTLVAPEQGAYEIKQLKPISQGDIKDKEHVRLP